MSAAQVKQFVQQIAPLIKAEAKRRGYKVFSPIIAQAVIESKYGQSGLAKYHNYFGLKCGSSWKGKSVNMKTKEEYSVGTLTSIRDNFRAYSSMEEGVKGYFDFISTKRYANLKSASTPKEYLERIKADGYATSSTYVNTNMNCINKYDLTKWDSESVVAPSVTSDELNIDKIAREVIAGKWGNGAERNQRLRAAGYNPAMIQARVNDLVKKGK